MDLSLGREIGIVAAVVCTVWIAVRVARNARRLNEGVKAFKAEQEKQDGVVDPYAALSGLYDPAKKPPGKRDGKAIRQGGRFNRRRFGNGSDED
jgi:hypothetical protein